MTLSRLLRLSGHKVSVAHEGPGALEQFEAIDPEFILLDIGLPEMDGYEVARRIRERPNSGRIVLVALTGYGPGRGPQTDSRGRLRPPSREARRTPTTPRPARLLPLSRRNNRCSFDPERRITFGIEPAGDLYRARSLLSHCPRTFFATVGALRVSYRAHSDRAFSVTSSLPQGPRERRKPPGSGRGVSQQCQENSPGFCISMATPRKRNSAGCRF